MKKLVAKLYILGSLVGSAEGLAIEESEGNQLDCDSGRAVANGFDFVDEGTKVVGGQRGDGGANRDPAGGAVARGRAACAGWGRHTPRVPRSR